jgi:hypothetical protein
MENIAKLIEKLAGKFGFDSEEAKAFIAEKSDSSSDIGSDKVKLSPIEKARKNLKVWTEKLEANKFKDEESKNKHEEKIAKEKAKLDKLENPPEAKPKAEPKKGKAKKETEVTPKKGKKTEEAPKAPKKGKKEEETESKPEKKEEVKVEKTEAESKTKTKKEENVRIKRLSAAQNKQLTEILTKVKLEMTDDHKRGFVKFVEEMSEDDFKSMSQLQQMQSYADSISRTPPLEGEAVEMTLGELQAIKMTATLDDIVGTYWDADKGRYVKGPDAVPDEDINDMIFEGKDYGVGEKTGRVYLEVNDKDVFQGFIGVGKFKAMSRT